VGVESSDGIGGVSVCEEIAVREGEEEWMYHGVDV
jgi:hypothetical protein